MEQGEYLFSGNAWFKERLAGPDGFYWRKARRMFLFDHDLASALNLFKFDYKAIKTEFGPEGTTLHGSRNTYLDPNEEREHRAGQSWADDAKNSIRILLDRIVTLWEPKYMKLSKISMNMLHPTLTPVPLRYLQKQYDDTNDDVESYDVKKALEMYQNYLTPLYYHELWSEIVHDYKNVDTKLEERETVINIGLFYKELTLDEDEETALIFGTNRATYVDSYKPLSNKLGLFDLILIKIDNVDYFGMVVHVQQNKVKVPPENENPNNNHKNLTFEIQTTIGIYVSRTCSDLIKQRSKATNDMRLTVTKLSNITSTRRMISAIHNLHEWSQHRSLLKPTIDDIYFQLPEDYDPSNISPTEDFNAAQSKTIAVAEYMFDDLFPRMHIVEGPPGSGKSRTIAGTVMKLLSKLSKPGYKQKKILLCAPSNNACDELTRRILDAFEKQDDPPRRGTLVRIGCQPPDDDRLCDSFLDFMILQNMVDTLKRERRPDPNLAQSTERSIMRHAKIVISTLNYCGSARMHQLKNSTAFVIIDEASQSSEADFLLPLRFGCNKVMLVGDPLQLPPCILSDAGKQYGLAESLYKRLYYIFAQYPNGPISMLDTQYRMHPDICRFPSKYFYLERLKTDPSVAIRMKYFSLKPLFLYDITSSPHRSDGAGSSYNEGEAGVVRDFCHKLIAHLAQGSIVASNNSEENRNNGYNSISSPNSAQHDTASNIHGQVKEPQCLQSLPFNHPQSIEVQQRIAVITPYKAQVRLLRSYLPPYIEIMTADGSQGKEKDIVILSCVRSGGNIGFLNDMNRVNVMLTRSKNALYVFGNLTQLARQHESWEAFVNHARVNEIISNVDAIPPDLPYRS